MKSGTKGVTLIELMITLGIAGLLVSAYFGYRMKKVDPKHSIIHQIYVSTCNVKRAEFFACLGDSPDICEKTFAEAGFGCAQWFDKAAIQLAIKRQNVEEFELVTRQYQSCVQSSVAASSRSWPKLPECDNLRSLLDSLSFNASLPPAATPTK